MPGPEPIPPPPSKPMKSSGSANRQYSPGHPSGKRMYEGLWPLSAFVRDARHGVDRHALFTDRRHDTVACLGRRRFRLRSRGGGRSDGPELFPGHSLQQRVYQPVGAGEQQGVRGRQRLVIHAPPFVRVRVHRALKDLRRRKCSGAGLSQRSTQIDPVETQDHVGFADHRACFGADVQARRKRMQRMFGRKTGGGLEIREYACIETLGKLHTLRKRRAIVRHPSDEDQRALRVG